MPKQNKISRSARGKHCTARIPGVPSHDPATVVLGHAPFPGKFGSRNDWWWSAYVCFECHEILDGRSHRIILTTQEKDATWFRAVHETQSMFIGEGLMEVHL